MCQALFCVNTASQILSRGSCGSYFIDLEEREKVKGVNSIQDDQRPVLLRT